MYWENLALDMMDWSVVMLTIGAALLLYFPGVLEKRLRTQGHRRLAQLYDERDQRHWFQEMRLRARNRAFNFLNRLRTPRLTDQRRPAD